MFWLAGTFPFPVAAEIVAEWLDYVDLVYLVWVVHEQSQNIRLKKCMLRNKACLTRWQSSVGVSEAQWMWRQLAVEATCRRIKLPMALNECDKTKNCEITCRVFEHTNVIGLLSELKSFPNLKRLIIHWDYDACSEVVTFLEKLYSSVQYMKVSMMSHLTELVYDATQQSMSVKHWNCDTLRCALCALQAAKLKAIAITHIIEDDYLNALQLETLLKHHVTSITSLTIATDVTMPLLRTCRCLTKLTVRRIVHDWESSDRDSQKLVQQLTFDQVPSSLSLDNPQPWLAEILLAREHSTIRSMSLKKIKPKPQTLLTLIKNHLRASVTKLTILYSSDMYETVCDLLRESVCLSRCELLTLPTNGNESRWILASFLQVLASSASATLTYVKCGFNVARGEPAAQRSLPSGIARFIDAFPILTDFHILMEDAKYNRYGASTIAWSTALEELLIALKARPHVMNITLPGLLEEGTLNFGQEGSEHVAPALLSRWWQCIEDSYCLQPRSAADPMKDVLSTLIKTQSAPYELSLFHGFGLLGRLIRLPLTIVKLTLHNVIISVRQLQEILSNWKSIAEVSCQLWDFSRNNLSLFYRPGRKQQPDAYYAEIASLPIAKWIYSLRVYELFASATLKVLNFLPHLSHAVLSASAVTALRDCAVCTQLQYLTLDDIEYNMDPSKQKLLLEMLKDIIQKHAYLKEFSIYGSNLYKKEDFAECSRERLKLVMNEE